MTADPALAHVRSWVGRTYAEMDCWQALVAANALRGVTLAADYYEALEAQLEPVSAPAPWDIVPLCLNRLNLSRPAVHVPGDHRGLGVGFRYVDHVGLYLGSRQFFHATPAAGATIASLDSERWRNFILRDDAGAMQFYRVRQ